jgi:hypothetical protein
MTSSRTSERVHCLCKLQVVDYDSEKNRYAVVVKKGAMAAAGLPPLPSNDASGKTAQSIRACVASLR